LISTLKTFINKPNPCLSAKKSWAHSFVIVVSILCSSKTIANSEAWQKIGTSKVGTTFYFDPNTLEDRGKTRAVMVLEDRQNTAKVRNHSYRSYVSMQVHDCQGRRSAIVSGAFFSGNRAQGTVVHKYKVTPWNSDFELVALGTMQEVIHRELCLGSWFNPPEAVSM
jgi:hypothetical protein